MTKNEGDVSLEHTLYFEATEKYSHYIILTHNEQDPSSEMPAKAASL